jgi:hypothetical protein
MGWKRWLKKLYFKNQRIGTVYSWNYNMVNGSAIS